MKSRHPSGRSSSPWRKSGGIARQGSVVAGKAGRRGRGWEIGEETPGPFSFLLGATSFLLGATSFLLDATLLGVLLGAALAGSAAAASDTQQGATAARSAGASAARVILDDPEGEEDPESAEEPPRPPDPGDPGDPGPGGPPGGGGGGAGGETNDLSIAVSAPFGAVRGGRTTYVVEVRNLGPADQSAIEVLGTPPAGATHFRAGCRSRLSGSEWRWEIGFLEADAVVSCTIDLILPSGCPVAIYAASVSSPSSDPEIGNNSAAASNGGGQLIADGSFESGTPNPFWQESSRAFGTPICDALRCGLGTGSGPRNGSRWAWFGGVLGSDEARLEQQLTIPLGTAQLELWLEASICDSPSSTLELLLDEQRVWSVDGTSELCGLDGYTRQTVDLTPFADGAAHHLALQGISTGGGHTNFFVDDLLLIGTPSCTDPLPLGGLTDVPALGLPGIALLIGALSMAGVLLSRRRRRLQPSA